MGAKTLIPKSKAKTAYGLLSEIRKLILEEPLRYDQHTYTTNNATRDARPACGTVCCVAGWVAVLKADRGVLRTSPRIEEFAEQTLGLTGFTSFELFDASAAGDADDAAEHARRGAEHITRFQEKYAAQLKAKRVQRCSRCRSASKAKRADRSSRQSEAP